MSASRIEYSEKYADDDHEYRYVNSNERWLFFRCQSFPFFTRDNLLIILRLTPFRHVILPKELLRQIHRGKLLTEAEWRSIGVQQSRGWQHYAIHRPEPHILLFRRPLGTDPTTGRVDPTLKAEALEEYKNQIGFKRCAQN